MDTKEKAMHSLESPYVFALVGALAVFGCNGKKDAEQPNNTDTGKTDTGKTGGTGDTAPADPNAEFGPLEKGADYASWTKLNKAPVKSKTHGGRFVDTYVNEVGLEAYKNDDAEIPVGTIIVKTSKEPGPDGPTEVDGPIFVMARVDNSGEAGWWYGFHWEKIPEKWQKALKGTQAYWRTPSKKVDYCSGCHDNYPRELGGIPKDFRTW